MTADNFWSTVGDHLDDLASQADRFNPGQQRSLNALARRLPAHGVLIADEVGMGKTRIAVAAAEAVVKAGGRVAILVPPGLGFQWQDELQKGKLEAPPVLRSLHGYFADGCRLREEAGFAWQWHLESVVLVSHGFANWKLGASTVSSWRWTLPLRVWQRMHSHVAKPENGHFAKEAELAAELIQQRIAHAGLASDLLSMGEEGLRGARFFTQGSDARVLLERLVGVGLGEFDLVIIDEAHKSRAQTSGLSRLQETVIQCSAKARRLAMTATPVELDAGQWKNTLSRIGLGDEALSEIGAAASDYAVAVERLRKSWRVSPDARKCFGDSAARFQQVLGPYVLRRDKRSDATVREFREKVGLGVNAYRMEHDLEIRTEDLSLSWRKTICAAESLSAIAQGSEEIAAKRLRLTLANGHGLSAVVDGIVNLAAGDDEGLEEASVDTASKSNPVDTSESGADAKRLARMQWWASQMRREMGCTEQSLFDHPGICAAAHFIETRTEAGQKVLVFGRFTKPMRALVQLLNARAMLKSLESSEPWPQGKVHIEEWPAVRAAHRQLQCTIGIEALDAKLADQYRDADGRREQFRKGLVERLSAGLNGIAHVERRRCLAFLQCLDGASEGSGGANEQPLVWISRALLELLPMSSNVVSDASPDLLAKTFCDLVGSLMGADDPDADDAEDPDKVDLQSVAESATSCALQFARYAEQWKNFTERVSAEFNHQTGTYARLMWGQTKQESRRAMQLAFNRKGSFLRVLVAQSAVGREGLNLHEACRTVVLLHPEWNPAVVEQQIGRVDRINSQWEKEFRQRMEEAAPAESLPRIDIHAVVFKGTYDEYNWSVLRQRWNDLRAQLHGIVIPDRLAGNDPIAMEIIRELERAAPDFSP